jgi:asparagine synthetase B (glutamine-hydrolysing)
MAKRVTFSHRNVDVEDHAVHHNDVEASLKLYFSQSSALFLARFAGDKPSEIAEILRAWLAELDLTSTLTVLGAVEAAFRIDYLQRCDGQKRKDAISRAFREIYRKKGVRASLEDEILEIWKTHEAGTAPLITALKGAFRLRHWLAHGRYGSQSSVVNTITSRSTHWR